jgi:hypothetical protein
MSPNLGEVVTSPTVSGMKKAGGVMPPALEVVTVSPGVVQRAVVRR